MTAPRPTRFLIPSARSMAGLDVQLLTRPADSLPPRRCPGAQFAEIVAVNPQIKLWMSGHFHLSHDYRDSISVRGETAFVQVKRVTDR